jgi:hypothetical protein
MKKYDSNCEKAEQCEEDRTLSGVIHSSELEEMDRTVSRLNH